LSQHKVRPLYWLLLALSLLFQVTAVVLSKVASQRLAASSLPAFLTNGWFLAGLGCLGLQAVCWQLVLRCIPLVVAYPITSVNFLLLLAASRIFFGEPINAFHVAGAVVIVVGVRMIISEVRA
jgi:multidrug transporter EmrE-like cation transporter